MSSSNVNKELYSKPKLWRSCRMSVTICIFLAAVQASMLRDNLGMAIICMSKPAGNLTCETNDAVVPTLPWLTNKRNCEFDWDSATRGRILGAFLYGFILTTTVGGYMSNRSGAKILFMWGGIGNAVFHLLCPTAALIDTEMFFACRFIQGIFSGLMVGPFFQLLGAWTTDDEASILLGIGFSGYSFGTILIYPMSGQLCSVNFNGFGGWPLIYYVPASLSVLFIIIWSLYLYDVPDNHPNISQEEYYYLLENVGISDEPATIPWMSILTSLPFIAYIVCYTSYLWNIFTVTNNLPLFLQTVFHVKPKETGYMYCIPFTITFLIRIINGAAYPKFKNYLGLSHTICRKLYFTFGSLMVIMSFISIIFIHNMTKWDVIIAITVNLAFGDFAYTGGFFPTLLDMAPNYAGLLSGVSTFVAFLGACPSTLVNSIIAGQSTKNEWDMVLWIIISLYSFSLCFYVIFGSASLQKWSVVQQEIVDGRTSRSTIILTQSYGAYRSMSFRHPSHIL